MLVRWPALVAGVSVHSLSASAASAHCDRQLEPGPGQRFNCFPSNHMRWDIIPGPPGPSKYKQMGIAFYWRGRRDITLTSQL